MTLDVSSTELIGRLIGWRYSDISQIDVRTLAEASGGNARIAIALAETVRHSGSIAGLSSEELFERLFRQRHDHDNALLLAAQACSLVYSFDGETLDGGGAELPRLAALVGQAPTEVYRHAQELLRRDLMQQRGVWRAVLPHALANRLAARALQDTPYHLIHQQLIDSGSGRLARSFSRRLSFLHDCPGAVAIVERWLAVRGLLGDAAALNDLGRAMFDNVAPVVPERALEVLERAVSSSPDVAVGVWSTHRSLLRSLAYDPALFERSADLLARAATQSSNEREAKETSDTLVSLFTICLSGTHATVEQRLRIVEKLLRSGETKARGLGLSAMGGMLRTTHFSAICSFEFGARSRDYGYEPRSSADLTEWYGAALTLIQRLATTDVMLKAELGVVVAHAFRGLWTSRSVHDQLEDLSRMFAGDGFWREGWVACRQALRFDRERLAPETTSRLSALEVDLRPSNLQQRVQAVILSDRSIGLDLGDEDADGDRATSIERLNATARELGIAVATDDTVFEELVPSLLRGGSLTWPFGGGLAAGSPDLLATWAKLVEGLRDVPQETRTVQVLRGFLAGCWQQDRDLAQQFLDWAMNEPALLVFLPILHTAVELDERGVDRLKRALAGGQVPLWTYRNLAFGRATDHVTGSALKELLQAIAGQPDGFDVALEVLYMRLASDQSTQLEPEPYLVEFGRELLQRAAFTRDRRDDHELAAIVRICLGAPDAGPIAAAVAVRLRRALAAYETYSFDNDDLLRALLELHPAAVLNALFGGNKKDQQAAVRAFEHMGDHRGNPADAVSCEVLVAWCEVGGGYRYAFAASIITFAVRPEADGRLVWSEQAKALLSSAPDPRRVLEVFIERFRPRTWSGSRAALMEANAQLLDTWKPDAPPLGQIVIEAKVQLAQDIARERQWEAQRDRERDERFE